MSILLAKLALAGRTKVRSTFGCEPVFNTAEPKQVLTCCQQEFLFFLAATLSHNALRQNA